MSNKNRFSELTRTAIFGLALIVGGCNLDALGSDEGRVRFILSRDGGGSVPGVANIVIDSTANLDDDDDDDHRAWSFQAATVTLSSIMVRNEDGVLTNLPATLPVTVDVVKIDGGKQVQLPDGILPTGNYDQVVLVITAVKGVTLDGTQVTIEPPGGGWTAIVPVCPFAVAAGATTPVGIAFNVRHSFLKLGSWWSFQPRFRSFSADCATG